MLYIVILVVLIIVILALPCIFPTLLIHAVALMLMGKYDDYEGWYYYGTLLAKHKRYSRAYNAFKTVIKIKPDCSMAWMKLGDLLNEIGMPEAAEEAYRMAMTGDLSEF